MVKTEPYEYCQNFDEYDGEFCDAIFTSRPKQACVVLTADCLPIILFDKRMTKVAAIHAGWKGLSKGILEETLKEFVGLDIVAWLGPCISEPFMRLAKMSMINLYSSMRTLAKLLGKRVKINIYLIWSLLPNKY